MTRCRNCRNTHWLGALSKLLESLWVQAAIGAGCFVAGAMAREIVNVAAAIVQESSGWSR